MMICAESLQLQMRRSTLDRSLHQRVFHGCIPAAVSPRTHQRASTPSLEVLAPLRRVCAEGHKNSYTAIACTISIIVERVDTKRRLLRVTVHCWVPTRTTYARESKLALRPKLSRIPRLSALTMPSDMRWEWCDLKEKTLRRVL